MTVALPSVAFCHSSTAVREPVAFELLREAVQNVGGNDRSALVMGVAAIEVGLKHCIARVAPDARWMVEEAPSPPVARMLREYLPTLPMRNTVAGEVKPPPSHHIDYVTKYVRLRNEIAHVGADASLDVDDLLEFLDVARDLLHLFDFYVGHEWAMEYVRDETRDALGWST